MKLQVDDVLPLCERYYEQAGNELGGSLHILLDDFNVEHQHVEFCILQASLNQDQFGAALAGLILVLSKTQRLKLVHKLHE